MRIFLYHGGKDGLRPGDLIEPGHERMAHPGCPWCAARTEGRAHLGIDGPAEDADRVYATTNRLYAKHYASLWGRGDLYRVEPVGDLLRSTEDSVESWKAPAMRVVAVLERAVQLTMSERRRLYREWGEADRVRWPELADSGREDN